MSSVTATAPLSNWDAELAAWETRTAARNAAYFADVAAAARPAVLPNDVDVAARLATPVAAEPCCDLEWLEAHADSLKALGHDAALAAEAAIRGVIAEMLFLSVHSVGDMEARRELYYTAGKAMKAKLASVA